MNWAKKMTIPFERTRALIETKSFLLKLVDTKRLPRVPKSVRQHAEFLLRHYPSYDDIELAHKALPNYFGPVPPFQRFQAKTAITELGLVKLNQPDGD